jgi:hypothetical protein
MEIYNEKGSFWVLFFLFFFDLAFSDPAVHFSYATKGTDSPTVAHPFFLSPPQSETCSIQRTRVLSKYENILR